jgi:glycosyltransferase involved in cell wall biosynthesis
VIIFIEKGLCDEERIRMIHGGVMPPLDLGEMPEKLYFGVHKKTVDICFAAWKYMPLGRDKGFDTFIHAARILAKRFAFVQFHVVGPWDEEEMDVSDLAGRIHFHAPMSSTDLRKFFRRIDLIVSPNRAFTLMPGKFDGFPLGCCVEAALSGVAVCATDELGQNLRFTHGRDILLCGVEAAAVADMAGEAIAHYDGLCELAAAGLRKFSEVFSWEAQMAPRLEVLSQLLSLPGAAPGSAAAPRPAAAVDGNVWFAGVD